MTESTPVVGPDSSLAVPSTAPTHPIDVDVSSPSLVGEGLVYLSTDELLVLDASKHRSPEYGLRGEALWRKWAELDGIPYSPRTRDNAPAGWAIGAVNARFSTPKQGSIRDQVRTCLEWAQNNRIHVVDDMVFVDWGLSGRSIARPQYLAMQEAARAKGYDVLLAFKTNRIGRSINEAIRIAKNELVPMGIRVVFVANRIDTAGGKGWVRRLKIDAFLDDLGTDANADAIQAAHIGQLRRKEKYRATPFGYYGKIVDGTTRLGKPRRELTVDPDAAKVVRYIFKLRVEDRLKKKAIARRLNMESIEPPPGVKRWDNQNVHNILNREAYIGKWCYGRVETSLNPETGIRESRKRDEPLDTVRHEDLRIISDVLFADAKRMQVERGRSTGDAAQTAAVREIVEIVTGGRIDVVQAGDRARFKGYPVGSFECDLAGLLAKHTGVRTELRSRTVIGNLRRFQKHERLGLLDDVYTFLAPDVVSPRWQRVLHTGEVRVRPRARSRRRCCSSSVPRPRAMPGRSRTFCRMWGWGRRV